MRDASRRLPPKPTEDPRLVITKTFFDVLLKDLPEAPEKKQKKKKKKQEKVRKRKKPSGKDDDDDDEEEYNIYEDDEGDDADDGGDDYVVDLVTASPSAQCTCINCMAGASTEHTTTPAGKDLTSENAARFEELNVEESNVEEDSKESAGFSESEEDTIRTRSNIDSRSRSGTTNYEKVLLAIVSLLLTLQCCKILLACKRRMCPTASVGLLCGEVPTLQQAQGSQAARLLRFQRHGTNLRPVDEHSSDGRVQDPGAQQQHPRREPGSVRRSASLPITTVAPTC